MSYNDELNYIHRLKLLTVNQLTDVFVYFRTFHLVRAVKADRMRLIREDKYTKMSINETETKSHLQFKLQTLKELIPTMGLIKKYIFHGQATGKERTLWILLRKPRNHETRTVRSVRGRRGREYSDFLLGVCS